MRIPKRENRSATVQCDSHVSDFLHCSFMWIKTGVMETSNNRLNILKDFDELLKNQSSKGPSTVLLYDILYGERIFYET